MKVILKKLVKNVGKAGDVVEVSDGYAKNCLLKQGLAVPASADNLNTNNLQKKAEEKAKREAKAAAEEMKKILDNLTLTIKATVGKNGNLFGSITNKESADELLKQKLDVDKKKIVISSPIKTLGNYQVTVKLYAEVSAKLKVVVCE